MQLKNNQLFRQQAYINGEWVDAGGKKTADVTNPSNGETLGHVPQMGEEETNKAIKAAQDALPAWRAMTAHDRAAKLRRWFELMMENQDDLAMIMTLEQGKPLAEAKGEITYAASFIEWFAEEAKRTYGETQPNHPADRHVIIIKQPVGVSAAITPWNFPSAMITRKAAPALAAGCTVVLKPSGQTPFSALALAELAAQAEIPAGVFNIVTGPSKEVGKALTDSEIVRKLSFTGSTKVGSQLMADSAGNIKKMSLELGGNAPFIVFEDADLNAAVKGAVESKFRNAGQVCVCTNRFYIQDSIYQAFADKFVEMVKKLRVGDGLEDGVDIGPLINKDGVEKVMEHIEDAVSHGAKIACGGKHIKDNFVEATVLLNVPNDVKIAHEETFGPLAALFRFKTEEEAIKLANNTPYGLAAYFFTQNLNRSIRVAEALESGMVGVNTGALSTETIPFGGIKSSGVGREGSRFGIDEYLELKTICIGDVK